MDEEKKNKTDRIGCLFHKEVEYIKDERLDKGIDKVRSSTRAITNKLVKHTNWEQIKSDLINFEDMLK